MLLGMSLAVGAVQVLMSYAGRDFMNAIAKKDPAAYWRMLWLYIGVLWVISGTLVGLLYLATPIGVESMPLDRPDSYATPFGVVSICKRAR